MDSNMHLLQEIRMTVSSINRVGKVALNNLEALQNSYGKDAIVFIIKCLAEDILTRNNDMQTTTDLKKAYLTNLLRLLFNKRPNTEILIKTAFDQIETPPGCMDFLHLLFTHCGLPNDLTIWISICTSSCTKQTIKQDALQLVRQTINHLKSNKISIQPDLSSRLASLQLNSRISTSQQPQPMDNIMPAINSLPSQDEASIPVIRRIGCLLAEIGLRASSNEAILHSIFEIAGDAGKSLDLNGLLSILLIVANHEIPEVEMQSAISSETNEDLIALKKQYPELKMTLSTPVSWSFQTLANVIKEIYANLDLNQLILCLDSPYAEIRGSQALRWLILLNNALTGKELPNDFIYHVWTNIKQQSIFLQYLLDLPDVYSFSSSPNQITIPHYFVADTKSCWVSLDLLHIIIELSELNEHIIALAHDHMRNALDITVILLALQQLKEPWTTTRYKLTARGILLKTVSLRQKPEQKYSVVSTIQGYLSSYPRETIECIAQAYEISVHDPNCHEFFYLLYESCSQLPLFVSSLSKLSPIPSFPNLQLIVHLIFLEAMNRGNIDITEELHHLYKQTSFNLLKVLNQLLLDFANQQFFVINRMDLAMTVIQFIQYIINNFEVPPEIKQDFFNIRSKIDMSVNYSQNTTVRNYLHSWLASTNPQERERLVAIFYTLRKTEDGCGLLRLITNEAIHLLPRVNGIRDRELVNLSDLIAILLQLDIVMKEQLADIIIFECHAFAEEQRHIVLFARHLLNNILPFICRIPNYVPSLLQEAVVKQSPEFAQELSRGYIQICQRNSYTMQEQSMMSPRNDMTSILTEEEIVMYKSRQAEITKAIEPFSVEESFHIPDERIKNRISVLINNLTETNLEQKVPELVTLIPEDLVPWFADYLVRSRIERQTNYHTLYSVLMQKMSKLIGQQIVDEIIRKSIIVCREILYADLSSFTEQHNFLRCMGEWIGLITIGCDVCLSQLHLNLTEELLKAFYHKRLIYVYEFICFILRGCKTSTVIRPPQPWLMAILSLLKEITFVPGISKMLGRYYKNMIDFIPFNDDDITIQKSELFLAIPEVANNPDFTSEATQSEVNHYFKTQYPEMKDLILDKDNHHSFNQAQSYHEFIPKSAQSVALSPTVKEPVLSASLIESTSKLSAVQRNELHLIVNDCMVQTVEIYNQEMRNIHYQIACTSLREMYFRDLADVSDAKVVLNCLEKATKSITGHLLSAIVPLIERKLILCLFVTLKPASEYITDNMIIGLASKNIHNTIEVISYSLFTIVMKDIELLVKEHDNQYQQSLEHDPHPANIASQFNEATDNEYIINHTLNNTQLSIYLNMTSPSLDDMVMTKEELTAASVRLTYKRIDEVLSELIKNESTMPTWITRFTQSTTYAKEMKRLGKYFNYIDSHHVEEEDNQLINFILQYTKSPGLYKNYHLMAVIADLTALFVDHGVKNISEYVTDTLISMLPLCDRISPLIGYMLILASHHLLNLKQLDAFFLQCMRSNNIMNKLPRILFTCLIEFVLLHEVIQITDIPETMAELAIIAKKEEGKKLIRFENITVSYELINEAIEKKAQVIKERSNLINLMKTEEISKINDIMNACIESLLKKDGLMLRISNFNSLISMIDDILINQPSINAFTILYSLLLNSIKYYSMNIENSYAATDSIVYLFDLLVKKEKNNNDKRLVFKAELDCLQALFYRSHDFNDPTFIGKYFLRVLLGILKSIILAETDEEQRNNYLYSFASFILATAPTITPIFAFFWLQLISTPQLLSLMINTTDVKLLDLEGDIVLRLFTFSATLYACNVIDLSKKFLQHSYDFTNILLSSFPGFLVRRASDYYPMVSDNIKKAILLDCPIDCNIQYAKPEEKGLVLKKALSTRVEPNMHYKQDLERVDLCEVAENVMLGRSVESNLHMIHHVLDLNNNMIVSLLRALIHYWVMEEERLVSEVDNANLVKTPEECMRLLFNEMSHPSFVYETIRILKEYIRFPCKETDLFMKAFKGLYRIMDDETQNRMYKEVNELNKTILGQYGMHMTLDDLHRN